MLPKLLNITMFNLFRPSYLIPTRCINLVSLYGSLFMEIVIAKFAYTIIAMPWHILIELVNFPNITVPGSACASLALALH